MSQENPLHPGPGNIIGDAPMLIEPNISGKLGDKLFEVTTRGRKEVTVEIMINEIERLKRDIRNLRLSPPWIDTWLGIFIGIVVSAVFSLSGQTSTSPSWATIGSWVLLGAGAVAAILCGVFKKCMTNEEKKEKEEIENDLDRWIGKES